MMRSVTLTILFVLGIGNFAMHQAVLHSGHPLLGTMPWFVHLLNGRLGLAIEFAVLFAAMIMTATGSTGAPVAYAIYTVLNAVSAWLIVTRRI